MTRGELERALLDLMEEAYKLFKAYDPEGNHLTMFATDSGQCAMGYIVAPWESRTIIDGYKSPMGNYRQEG